MKSKTSACRTKTKLKESDVQKAIMDYLDSRGILNWRVNLGGVPHTVGGKIIYRKNPMKGFPDISALYCGLFVGIEVKAKTKQSQEQLDWQNKFESNGAIYIVAKSVDDVIDCLNSLTLERVV
jgi:hypothetical protein